MATLYYAFCDAGSVQNGASILAANPASAVSATITLSASNQQSAAATKPFARVVTDTACYIAAGANPDATTAANRFYLPANTVEIIPVGVGNKIAANT